MTDAGTGGEVSLLQDFLNPEYLSSEPTGFFGKGTLAAVKNFQTDNHLLNSGYVGTLTRGKIRDLTCGGSSSASQTNQSGQTLNVQSASSGAPVISSWNGKGGSFSPGDSQTVFGQRLGAITSAILTSRDGSRSYGLQWKSTSDTSLGIVMPSNPAIPAGTYNLYLKNASGTSSGFPVDVATLASSVSAAVKPTITSVTSRASSPDTIYVGQTAYIRGTGLGGQITIRIGDRTALSVVGVSDTDANFVVPSMAEGYAAISVTNASGETSPYYGALHVIVPTTTTATVVPTSVDTPAGSLSLSSPSCTIMNGYSDCTVFASWSTTGVSSVNLVNDKGAGIDAHSPNISAGYNAIAVAVAYGGTTFTLKNAVTGSIISSKSATASCGAGSSWNTTTLKCSPTPAPTLTSFAPTVMTAGSNTSIVIYGTGFKPGATIVYSGSSSGESPAASYVSADGTQMNIGSYTFGYAGAWTFRVKNPDGQVSGVSRTFTINVPSAAPTVQSFSLPSTVNVNDTITATWTGSSDAASYQFNATTPPTAIGTNLEGRFSPLTTSNSWSGTAAGLGLSAGTTYAIGIKACTSNGTCGNASYRTIAVNATATTNTTPVYTAPTLSVSAATVTTGATVTFTVDTKGGTGCYWAQNGQFGGSISSGATPVTTTGLSGTYYMTVVCSEPNGQTFTSNQVSLTVNAPVSSSAPAPVLTVQSFTLSRTTAGLNDSFTASWTGSSDARTYQFNANGGAFSPFTSATSWTGTPASLGFSAGTSYAIGIKACDSSGTTCGAPSYATIAITGSPATISIGVTGTTLYWSASSNASSCSFRVNGAPWANLSPLTGTSPLTGIGLTVGTPYMVEAFCLNASGQQGPTSSLVYTPTVAAGPAQKQTASAIDALASATTSGVTSGFHYTWSRNLEIGSPYPFDVTALQTALTREGVYTGEGTGGFYGQTFSAVKAFQQKYGIEATGFVGAATRAKLNSLYAK